MFINFFVLNHVCKLCQRMAKYNVSIDNLCQKYITRAYACEFGGPHKVVKHTFSKKKSTLFFFVAHLFWPPRTSPDSFSTKK